MPHTFFIYPKENASNFFFLFIVRKFWKSAVEQWEVQNKVLVKNEAMYRNAVLECVYLISPELNATSPYGNCFPRLLLNEIIHNFETINVQHTLCKKKGCPTGGILSEFLLHTAFLGKGMKGRWTYWSYLCCRKMFLACKYTQTFKLVLKAQTLIPL